VCKWDGYSNFARVMCGEHVIFMHENVMEMCGEKLANWRCRRRERGQRGRREVLGNSRMYVETELEMEFWDMMHLSELVIVIWEVLNGPRPVSSSGATCLLTWTSDSLGL